MNRIAKILAITALFTLLIPAFASADEIWTINRSNMNNASRLMIATLQGQVAKEKPGILILSETLDTLIKNQLIYEGWTIRSTTSPWTLITEFRSYYSGAILCDLNQDSLNVATSLAGPMDAIVIDTSLVSTASAYGIPTILDVRGRDERWAFDNYKHLCAKGIAVEQDEAKAWNLRDLAIV